MSSASSWTHYFSDPLPAGVDARNHLGGKGASLYDMTRAGLRVPPGFTISTVACERYYADGKRWPDGLDAEVRRNLERLERDTGRTFGKGPKPLLVSVRSGAAQSMPGMMDTLLNCGLTLELARDLGEPAWFYQRYLQFLRMFAKTVHGLGEESFHHITGPMHRDLIERHHDRFRELTGQAFPQAGWDLLAACIDAVFASWNSERAVTYRQRHDIRGIGGTAVNVQAMWPSEVSGICFTQDPTNLVANRIVIEASYGLGEAVVSGDVAPDRFLISRNDHQEIETTLGHKVSQVAAFGETTPHDPDAASLLPNQLAELVDLSMKVEKYFGHPVDVEWGLVDGTFALLQARAIRGLEVAEAVEQVRLSEIEALKIRCNGQRRLWVAHNLGETLRAPTPLTWDIIRRFMSGAGGFGILYQQLGYHPSAQVRSDGFLDLIAGRIYADPDRLAGLFFSDMPLTYDLDELAKDRTLLDQAPKKFDPGRTDPLFLFRLPRSLFRMWRSSRVMGQARKDAKAHFERDILPGYLEYVRMERDTPLEGLNEQQLFSRLEEQRRRVLDAFGPESLKPGFFAGLALENLQGLLTQIFGPQDGAALCGKLLLSLEGDITYEQDAMLHDVAQGKATLPDFLARFGHRTIGEMELMTPRWREHPLYLEQTITRLRTTPGIDPHALHDRNRATREQAEADLPDLLKKAGGSSFLEEIRAALTEARALLPYRESGKFYLMLGYEQMRRTLETLAQRRGQGSEFYFQTLEELAKQPLPKDTLNERRVRWQAAQRLDLPEVISSQDLDTLGLPRQIHSDGDLVGVAMAPGVGQGTVRVVHNPQEAGELGSDYVLVCASTDPGWTPLFLHARGLVVERGGVLSHGAIVARDFGIPAISCPQATQILKTGDVVRVDGNQGRVFVIERSKAHA